MARRWPPWPASALIGRRSRPHWPLGSCLSVRHRGRVAPDLGTLVSARAAPLAGWDTSRWVECAQPMNRQSGGVAVAGGGESAGGQSVQMRGGGRVESGLGQNSEQAGEVFVFGQPELDEDVTPGTTTVGQPSPSEGDEVGDVLGIAAIGVIAVTRRRSRRVGGGAVHAVHDAPGR